MWFYYLIIPLALRSNTHTQANTVTFHLALLRIYEDSRSDVVVKFEPLHWFESDQNQSRIFKLLDGVHLVPLHHYLLLTIRLQQTSTPSKSLRIELKCMYFI